MKIVKNKEGEVVSIKEVETPISSENIKSEISNITVTIDTHKTRIRELETTLKQVSELENQK